MLGRLASKAINIGRQGIKDIASGKPSIPGAAVLGGGAAGAQIGLSEAMKRDVPFEELDQYVTNVQQGMGRRLTQDELVELLDRAGVSEESIKSYLESRAQRLQSIGAAVK